MASSNLIKYFSATAFMGINMIYTIYLQAKGFGKVTSVITSFRSFFLVIIDKVEKIRRHDKRLTKAIRILEERMLSPRTTNEKAVRKILRGLLLK